MRFSSADQYDVESGTLGEEVLTVGEDERIAGVAWDAVDQRYVRFVQGQVVTCDANGNEIVKAYIPVFDATENGAGILLGNWAVCACEWKVYLHP